MYKAVISDLDGTLLCRGHHVTKFTKDVIKEIIEKGINFYIASGRSYDQIGYITEQLEVKIPIIAANGARIFDADGNISLLFANEGSLEVFSANCNKAKAAEVLLERDGLTLKDAVSFGDGLNDYELITETGLGFAMGNSIYLLLEKLTDTEVIESNAEDGMAKRLRELFNL